MKLGDSKLHLNLLGRTTCEDCPLQDPWHNAPTCSRCWHARGMLAFPLLRQKCGGNFEDFPGNSPPCEDNP